MGECAAFLRRGGEPRIGSVESAGKVVRGVYAGSDEDVVGFNGHCSIKCLT